MEDHPELYYESLTGPKSILKQSMELCRTQLEATAVGGNFDVVVEVECDVGSICGHLNLPDTIDLYGIDASEKLIDFCHKQHGSLEEGSTKSNCTFQVVDPMMLKEWWNAVVNADGRYHKPLILCLNNTISNLPSDQKAPILHQILDICGENGKAVAGFWNGNYFSYAMMNYYPSVRQVYGDFVDGIGDPDIKIQKKRVFHTTDNRHVISWQLPIEVQAALRAQDVDISAIVSQHPTSEAVVNDQINTLGMIILAYFSQDSRTKAKAWYDDDGVQQFYQTCWGKDTIHLGRHDLLSAEEKASLSTAEQEERAQELHETEFIKFIKRHIPDQRYRVVDFGCGQGGLLRRLSREGILWSGVGIDMSSKMCAQARQRNTHANLDKDIKILEESYLHCHSITDSSVDLVISMDSLLHVGPNRQARAVSEAARILRPGGWLIFSDLMQKDNADPVAMQPIYDRLNLASMGTISNYKRAMLENGFTSIATLSHSTNIAAHYQKIYQVFLEKADTLEISQEYYDRTKRGLEAWISLAPKNIVWSFVCGQKTRKPRRININGN